MRREEKRVERRLHRYLRFAYHCLDHQCSFGCCDAYHPDQLGVEAAHVKKTKVWAFARICSWNAVSINLSVRNLEQS